MGQIYREYKEKGFEVLFAAINDNPDVPNFMRRFNVPFIIGTAKGDDGRTFMEFSMVSPAYVPWTVVVDRKGVIRAQFSGSDGYFFNGGSAAVKKVVDPLLAEKAAPAPATKKGAVTKKKT